MYPGLSAILPVMNLTEKIFSPVAFLLFGVLLIGSGIYADSLTDSAVLDFFFGIVVFIGVVFILGSMVFASFDS